MQTGKLTISIDLELGWGNWDNISNYHIENIINHERVIITRLLGIFSRYEISVTWAFVAALLDVKNAQDRPGDQSIWFAPEVIEEIVLSKVSHDIGSHGGRHRYFDNMSEEECIDDLQYAAYIHKKHGLALKSFVFPRNKVAKTNLLAAQGIKIYRGQDISWHQSIRNHQELFGRVANLVDKMFPIAPQVVKPDYSTDICNLPGSMLFFGRKGVRKFVNSDVMSKKLEKGLNTAVFENAVFHLWFHPSNFWHDTDQQFRTFERFIAKALELSSVGHLEIKPMSEFV